MKTKKGILFNIDFYKTLFEDSSVSGFYEITGYLNQNISHNLTLISNRLKKHHIYAYQLFPNYLDYKISNKNKVKKVKQKLGFAIHLKNHSNIIDYLKQECSTQHRKNIVRATNKLENSFNITYKTYFGSISKVHYEYIMNSLREMILKRFQQREGRNLIIKNWNHYFEHTFNLINEKKGSLFVVYDGDKPIEVSINYHLDSIMYSSISSFDLDYGKFSLGNIEIYKQLDWCLLNSIMFFDMGYGDLAYKRKWSNHIYQFEHHTIYHKINILGDLYSYLLLIKYQLTNYLISKKINDKFHNLIDKLKKVEKTNNEREYELIIIDSSTDSVENDSEISNISSSNNSYLRKPIYDYLYRANEHIKDVKVFKANHVNSYIVQGKNSYGKLNFNSQQNG